MNLRPTPEQQARNEAEKKRRAELDLSLNRKFNTMLGGWRRCGNRVCRRARRCAGFPLKCHIERKPKPPLTPEQQARARHSLRIALDRRRAELAAGAQPMESADIREMLRKKRREKKLRKQKAREALARQAPPPPVVIDAPAAAVQPAPPPAPQVSPEVEERVNRIWADYVATLPDGDAAADHSGSRRRHGPRITQL